MRPCRHIPAVVGKPEVQNRSSWQTSVKVLDVRLLLKPRVGDSGRVAIRRKQFRIRLDAPTDLLTITPELVRVVGTLQAKSWTKIITG